MNHIWTDLLLLLLLGLMVAMFLLLRREGDDVIETGSAEDGWPTRWLREAGYPAKTHVLVFFCSKLLCAVTVAWVVSMFVGEPTSRGWMMIFYLALLFSFLPDLWLHRARKARKEKVASGLSYFLDLLVSFLRTGLPVERAFFRAGREAFIGEHPISEEIEKLEGEVKAGRERAKAFEMLAERTGVEELRMIAATLRISVRQGSEIADTLSVQADLLRVKRREKAHRKISTMSALAVVPVFLCGVPIFMVVVYFPAVLQVMEVIKSLRF